jgi:hypothetical protein
MRNGRALLGIALVLLLPLPALAQRATATVRGTVTDLSQAPIAGAKVTVTNEDTGLKHTGTTNSSGLYSFADLPVGMYRIEVEYPGFKSAVYSKIVLNVADVRAVDAQLAPGAVTEQITVEVPAVAVQTLGGDVSGLVTGQQVRELPLNGRNFMQLALLMPGVTAPDFLNVKDKGLLGGSDISVSGSGVTSNLWTVDGANNNDVGSNRTILVYPSVDAIEEFKIHRNSYGAEFGQAAGAQVNIVTRGGTDTFQGSLFYFGRNDSLASTNYFIEKAGQEKDKLQRHDFGWSIGGPIVKGKLHFFASQEWNQEDRGSVRQAFVPTAAERNGDFSGPVIPGCSSPIPSDPLTGAPFPGNKIPANRLSPGGLLYLQLYPLPNATPNGNCNNWVQSLTSPIRWRQENVRFDYTMSDTTRLMVRYTQDSWTNNSPNLQSNLWGDDPFPAVDSNWDQPGRSLVAQLNQTIGSRGVNTLQFSYSANKIKVTRGGTDPGLNDRINAAIPSAFANTLHEYGADRGHPVFWGGQGYGQALWNEAPFNNNQDLFILKDDYSAVFGKHFMKIGALGSMNKKNEDVGGYGSFEAPAFWGSTGLNGTGSTTGNILADFLLRDMTFGFSEASGQRQVPQRWKDLEFYVADSWKASSRLTLDAGVRYSYFQNPYADDNKIMSFQPSLFKPALGADPCNGLLQPPGTTWCQDAGALGGTTGPNRSLTNQDSDLIAPRIGIAWDVNGNGKTALRAGVGQFFLRERLSPGLNIGSNPPFVETLSGSRKLDTAAEPCPGCFATSAGVPKAGRELKALTPNNWQWNLTFEQEVARNTKLELSYVGNKGTHLLRTYDANQVRAGDINHNGIDDRLEYALQGAGVAADVRPFGVFGDSRIVFWDHSGSSIYHSLQTELTSHFGRGSQFQAAYTFSRTIGNDPLDNSDGGLSANLTQSTLDNPGLDRGLTRTNRTHVFNASLVLVLPSFENKDAFTRNVFGDWEFTTIAVAASGIPLTVFTGQVPGVPGGVGGTGYNDNQRPNRVAGQPCSVSGGLPEQFLNPAAFTLTGFQLGTFGNSGRGICNGPDLRQVDVALYKNIKFTGKVRAQLRFEVFNVFNRNNFMVEGFNNSLNPITATVNGGVITSYTLPDSFGQATRTRDARQAQFGVKLMF